MPKTTKDIGMHVVVTGATGNVGSALLRRLVRDESVERITGIARRAPQDALPKVEWVAADITEADLVPLLEGADAVVHAAWLIQPTRDHATTRRVNVDGSRRVFEAAAAAGVPTLVHMSSLAVYSPDGKPVASESAPTTGIPSSDYSRDKVAAEEALDEVQRGAPQMRTVRMRPTLIFQRAAGTEIRRYFAGPFLPRQIIGRIPVLPLPRGMKLQAVHTDDVADAIALAIHDDDAHGAYNVAADPVIGIRGLAAALGARAIPVPASVLRPLVTLAWRARLQPTSPGWLDLGVQAPLLDSRRLRDELGWRPQRDGREALADLLDGMRSGAGAPTPPLDPATSGPARVEELRTGVGARSL